MRSRFRRLGKAIRRYGLLAGVRSGLALGRLLNPSTAQWLGDLVGRAAYHMARRNRRRALRHLALAYGDEMAAAQRQRVVRDVFRHLGRSLFEVFLLPSLGGDQFEALVDVEGLVHLDDALAAGRGVLLVTAHLGNWELLAAWVARRGYPLSVLARPSPNPLLDPIVRGFRERLGVRQIDRGGLRGARESLGVLRRGECLGILMDQDTRVDGVFADFFGRPAYTPSGPAALALKTGTPVVFVFIARGDRGRHRVTFDPPMVPEPSADRLQAVQATTEAFNRRIEQAVRAHPSQWVWMHRRWRTQPGGSG